MYNRYIHNDNGTYTRIREDDPPSGSESTEQAAPPGNTASEFYGHQQRSNEGFSGILRHILDQLHLDNIDTGDLILLGLLFFLSREDADEELLMALGLLLIL